MADETPGTPETPATPATPAAGTPTKKRNLVPILIVVGVIVVVIIGAVAYKLKGSSSSSKATGTPAGVTAKQLYKDWLAGDQTAAAKSGSANAVTQMFAIKTTDGTGLVFGGCTKQGADPFPKECVWTRPGGQLTMTVVKNGKKAKVTKVHLGAAATTPTTPTG